MQMVSFWTRFLSEGAWKTIYYRSGISAGCGNGRNPFSHEYGAGSGLAEKQVYS